MTNDTITTAPAGGAEPVRGVGGEPRPVGDHRPADASAEHPHPTTEESIGAIETQFSVLFARVRAAMKHYAEQLAPDLPPSCFKVLNTIDRQGPIHAGELAAQLEIDKSSLSRQLAVLDSYGFLERVADPADGRAKFLSLTPETTAKLADIRSSKQASMHENLRMWTADDLTTFARLLDRINSVPL